MLNDPGGGVSRGDVARCLCDRQVRNYEEPVNTRALQRLAGAPRDAAAVAPFFGVALSVVMEVRLYCVCR